MDQSRGTEPREAGPLCGPFWPASGGRYGGGRMARGGPCTVGRTCAGSRCPGSAAAGCRPATCPTSSSCPSDGRGCREATFHAGLELAPLHLGLWILSWAPRLGLLRGLAPLAPVATAMARALERFGTDRGGMRVEVEGRLSGRRVRRSWTLVAGSGHGPWVPAAPAARSRGASSRATRRRPARVACLGALSLAAALAELRHLDIATYVERSDG